MRGKEVQNVLQVLGCCYVFGEKVLSEERDTLALVTLKHFNNRIIVILSVKIFFCTKRLPLRRTILILHHGERAIILPCSGVPSHLQCPSQEWAQSPWIPRFGSSPRSPPKAFYHHMNKSLHHDIDS